jgi:hypothetical protein
MIVLLLITAAACSSEQSKTNQANSTTPAAAPAAVPATGPAPAKAGSSFTVADIAKIKWLEGSYRGTGGQKPFFNRYHFNGTTLNIESYNDEAMTKKVDSAVYELKDGMFANPSGKDRFAASEITDDHVQFVTITEKYAILRMERQGDGSVTATFETTGPDGNPNRQTFTLERLKK